MTHEFDTPTGPWTRPPIAALAVVVLVLALLAAGLLAGRAAGNAFQPPSLPGQLLSSAEDEPEEQEWEAEEEWAAEEEESAEEEAESTRPDSPQGVPYGCVGYTVAARVVSTPAKRTVRLEVSYETEETGRGSLTYWLKGNRGALKIGAAHWQLSRWGHVERATRLSPHSVTKVQAARSFVVQAEMPGTPSYCKSYGTRHLTIKHRAGKRTVWSERASGTQPLRRPALHR
jgi:hypothetical protein